MDFIQRLALLIFLTVVTLLPNSAYADYVPTRYFKLAYPATSNYYDTYQLACAAHLAHYNTITTGRNYTISICSENSTRIVSNPYKSDYEASTTITSWKDCGQGKIGWSISPSGLCTGTPPPACEAGTVVYDQKTKKEFGNKIECWDSCEVYTQGAQAPQLDCDWSAGGTGICYYLYHTVFKQTGNSCTGDNTPPEPATETPQSCTQCECFEKGGSWGTVGTIQTCVPQGSPGSAPVQTTPPPKTTTSTPAPTPENPNPTPVKTETQPPVVVVTPPPAGSGSGSEPSITETTTNADGTTTTTTQSKGQYCAEKPTAEVCKGDGSGSKNSFGGSCKDDGTADVACDGDAIQCAIARQQKETDCKLFKPDQAMTDKFNEAKNDNGSTNPASAANITTVHLPTSLNASSPYSGQCIQDVTISVASSSVSLPFSAWCPYLEAIGYLFLACAYISAAFILGSAI